MLSGCNFLIRKLVNKSDGARNKFIKAEKELNSKKEHLFKLNNPSKWEMSVEDMKTYNKELLTNDKILAFNYMCNKDNEDLLNLKQQYALYSTTLLSEYERIRNLNGETFSNHFVSFSMKNIEILTNVLVL